MRVTMKLTLLEWSLESLAPCREVVVGAKVAPKAAASFSRWWPLVSRLLLAVIDFRRLFVEVVAWWRFSAAAAGEIAAFF